MNLLTAELSDIAKALADRSISSEELVRFYLSRIDRYDSSLRAFVHLDREEAFVQARNWDSLRTSGEIVPQFAGIPIGIKDLLLTKGMPTTACSSILQGYVPAYSSTAVTLLQEAGFIILGKLNMDEFAMGSSNETSSFGSVRNPWDYSKVPGGSSGGSAAAVAARLVPAAIGTDTGGSIRQPASLCGITGLKPTYGRVSRYGVIAYASSLDQVGPITVSANDAATLLSVIGEHDPKDGTSAHIPGKDYHHSMEKNIENLKGKRIGIIRNFFDGDLDLQIKEKALKALKEYESLGCEIVELNMPSLKHAIPVYYIVSTAEASSNLARYDGVRYGLREELEDLNQMYERTRSRGFGEEVKRRIILGTYVLSASAYDSYYVKAQKVRTLIREEYKKAFQKCDVIAAPTSPTTAFDLDSKLKDQVAMHLSDIFTVPSNLDGGCSISIPCGFDDNNGLPIGLQLLGSHFDEESILGLASCYQQITDWHRRLPPLRCDDTRIK